MITKVSLQENKLSLGSWISLAHPAIAEIMAKAGFDWLVVDLEHSVITVREAEELIRIIDLAGVTPLVRLTSNSPDQIKRVMDAGAQGIIVPMVNTPEEARRAIKAVKYAPIGNRSVGLARAQGYGANFKKYFQWQLEEPIVIIQIEHIDAVNNIEEIFSVPDIDGYLIGPYDLSASMNLAGQFEHPEFISVIRRIHDSGKKFNIPSGYHLVEPDVIKLQTLIKEGFVFIAYSLDIRMLDVSCRYGIQSISAI